MKRLILAAVAVFLICNAFAQETRYVDASELTVIGKAMDTPHLYHRLDTAVYSELSEGANRNLRYPAGMAISFKTDSRSISAEWESKSQWMSHNNTPIAQKGFDLYVKHNGQWVYAAFGCDKPDKPSHKCTLIKEMDGSVKEFLMYLPLQDEISWLKIGVEKGAEIIAGDYPFRRKIVVMGSSITQGFSASRPGMAYPARMSRATGLNFVNLGISGQCKLQPVLAQAIADTEADAFVFDCFSNPSSEEIEELFDGFVARIRESHPDTPLIFVQTLVRESGNFNMHTQDFELRKRTAGAQKVKALMERDSNVYFIDPGLDIGTDHEGTVDGVHPTDLGFTRIIKRIQPQIVEILDIYGIK